MANINTIAVTQTMLETMCASQHWQTLMRKAAAKTSVTSTSQEGSIPRLDKSSFIECSNQAFDQLTEQDWLEAFAGHPMIGDISSLREKYAQGKHLSETEQSQVSQASEQILQLLVKLNHHYLDKFGFIFIVCATHKSADDMLALLQTRILNNRETELQNAATEQRKISHIRMEKLF